MVGSIYFHPWLLGSALEAESLLGDKKKHVGLDPNLRCPVTEGKALCSPVWL